MAWSGSEQTQVGVGVGLGGASAINAINSPVPRSIASALARMDVVGERLVKVRDHLNALADQIGGPRPTDSSNGIKGQAGLPTGAVHRLNDSADRSNEILGDIEDLLGSISRSLG
jgi:hypothetical protein